MIHFYCSDTGSDDCNVFTWILHQVGLDLCYVWKKIFLKLGTEAIIGLSGLSRYQWESRIIFSHFENT